MIPKTTAPIRPDMISVSRCRVQNGLSPILTVRLTRWWEMYSFALGPALSAAMAVKGVSKNDQQGDPVHGECRHKRQQQRQCCHLFVEGEHRREQDHGQPKLQHLADEMTSKQVFWIPGLRRCDLSRVGEAAGESDCAAEERRPRGIHA